MKYRATLKSDDQRQTTGYYCQVEGKHYFILHDAELVCHPFAVRSVIDGFVEIVLETMEEE